MNNNEKWLMDILCPGNEILYDKNGKGSVMVKIPRQTYAQLGLGDSDKVHPAFIVNGKTVDAIYISKYENVIEEGLAYSLPMKKPAVSMNYDEAQDACTKKGRGWHLMTKAEWALLAQWCLNQGKLPKGNCSFGKDLKENGYQALPATESDGRVNLVLTGTGPCSWSHNGELSGIWDLKGNLGEWVSGARTFYGELQLLVDNNGADGENSQSAGSCEWKAVNGLTGEFCTPDGKGTTENSLKLEYADGKWNWTIKQEITHTDKFYGCPFAEIQCGQEVGAAAVQMLQAYGFLKTDSEKDAYEGACFYADSGAEEKFFGCGGHYKHGVEAGVFCAHGTTARTAVSATRGFRSAFVKIEE